MVVYHLNLDVAGTDILCVFGSLLMVVFFFQILGVFHRWTIDLESPFYFHHKWGEHLPYAQLVHQKPANSQGTGESCRHQWHPLHAPGHGKITFATKNSRFSHLSVNMVGNQSSIVRRDVKNCCGFTNESFVLRSLLYDKFAERKAQKILSNFLWFSD